MDPSLDHVEVVPITQATYTWHKHVNKETKLETIDVPVALVNEGHFLLGLMDQWRVLECVLHTC